MDKKKYTHPPLVEAICAFQFAPSAPWDATILGLVYDRLKEEFPVKAQAPGPLFNLTIGAAPSASTERMQFRRADNRALVQVGPDALTVNHLTPYCGWPDFRVMIESALDAYREVATPVGLTGISLRYINRLNIPAAMDEEEENGVDIRHYLLAHPVVPEGVPQMFFEWAQRVMIPFESAQQVLVVQSGTALGNEQNSYVFLLDLDARPFEGQTVSLADTLDWLEVAHTNIGMVFESCLGTKARLLFEEKIPSTE